jgi:predicted AAA+ superfamily ATPase
MGIPNTSVGRYLSLLETIFLIQMLPAWTTNIGKRVIKSPRILFSDTGLACHLLGVDASHLASDHTLAASLFENFVVAELHKQASWCELPVRLHHFRSLTGQEVDVVLEDRAGRICGIEIKFTASVSSKHLSGLKSLREFAGKRFVCGVMLYAGNEIVPFGEKLFAIPVSALWLN